MGGKEPDNNAGGCENVRRHSWFGKKEIRKDIVLLEILEEKGVQQCGISDMLAFFEALHLSAAGGGT